MRRIVFVFIMMTGIACLAIACARSDEVPTVETSVYYVDAELNRLLPYTENIIDADTEHMVQAVLDKLIEGRDDSNKIRRLIPDIKGCMSVRVSNYTAYVDISSEIAASLPFSRDIEKLVIYQIVDSVTQINGIRFVRFTVDGEIRKDFMGYYDMRETYKYTYPE